MPDAKPTAAAPAQNQPKPASVPPAGAKRTEPVPAAKKKPKKHISLAAIFCIVLVVLFTGAIAMVYFDLAGFKDMAVSALKLQNPTAAQLAELDKQKKDLAAKQAELTKTTTDQTKKNNDLTKREKALAAAEKDLKDQQAKAQATASAQPSASADTSQPQSSQAQAVAQASAQAAQQKLQASVEMFGKMNPAKAAQALSTIKSTTDIARILANLNSDQAAAILNNMNPKLTTKIMSEMIKMK